MNESSISQRHGLFALLRRKITQVSIKTAIIFVLIGVVLSTISLVAGYQIGKNETSPLAVVTTPTPTLTPSPTVTITATPSAQPTVIVTRTPTSILPTILPREQNGKLALHVDVIDHSDGRPAGLITDVTVQLFNMDGTLMEEKRPSQYVQDGPVGSGGDAVFYVLPSTYKVSADIGHASGTCTITVRATTEYNSCAIYVVRK